MKINYTIKIGSVALATLLTALVNSCASHETGVVTPINLPKVQHTLAAPKSLEGAWIRLRSHSEDRTITNWWYIKNGKAYQYADSPASAGKEMVNGHPVSPTSIDTSWDEDNLGRRCYLCSYTYVPTGATAKLYINYRDETFLCRSVSENYRHEYVFHNEPALITVKSVNQGVYEGAVEGVIGNCYACWANHADSITIFTK